MRIGIFGGSFNPIHIGHLMIAGYAVKQLKLDKLFFVPANINPFKIHNHPDIKDRLAMVKLATKGNRNFAVSDVELKRGGVSYTIDTLKWFKQKNPKATIFLIVGSDSLKGLPRWKDARKIIKMAKLVIAPRKIGILNSKFLILNSPVIDISSSIIRKRVKDGKPIKYLVPETVRKYILGKGLYK